MSPHILTYVVCLPFAHFRQAVINPKKVSSYHVTAKLSVGDDKQV